MEPKDGGVIQVGGRGKGCGKTTLIARLIRLFPGSVYIKSTHHLSISHGDSDQKRCLRAGAARAYCIRQGMERRLMRILNRERREGVLIMLELNRRLEGLNPDLYIFIDRPVSRPRQDAIILRTEADIILTDLEISPTILQDRIACVLAARNACVTASGIGVSDRQNPVGGS